MEKQKQETLNFRKEKFKMIDNIYYKTNKKYRKLNHNETIKKELCNHGVMENYNLLKILMEIQ